MDSLWVAFVLSSTVLLSVTAGVLAAYGAVSVILHAFAYQTRQPARTAILVPSQNPAGGD